MKMQKVTIKLRRRNRVEKTCCVCGTVFYVQPSKVLRIQSCELCRSISRKPPANIECKFCHNQFTVKGHLGDVQMYCGQECRYADMRANRRGRVRVHIKKLRIRKPARVCDMCGCSFRKKRKTHKNK